MRARHTLWKQAVWAFLLMFTLGSTVAGRLAWAQESKPPPREMTPEEKKAYLESHPEAKERLEQRRENREELLGKLKNMKPEEREAFLKEHPRLREQFEKRRERRQELREDLKNMSPEDRKAFLESHPKIKERLEQRRQERRESKSSQR